MSVQRFDIHSGRMDCSGFRHRYAVSVAGAGFWRLLILMDEPVVEVRRGTGGAVVATASVSAGSAA